MSKFLLFVAFVCLLAALYEPPMGSCAETPQSIQRQPSARADFKLPKLFDFERFKSIFKKSYRSIVEDLARKRLYLGRAFQVFLSVVSYKHMRANSYQAINDMSDWTTRETDYLILKDKMEDLIENGALTRHEDPEIIAKGKEDLKRQRTELFKSQKDDETPRADLDEIQMELKKIMAKKESEPGFRAISEELTLKSDSSEKEGSNSDRQVTLDQVAGPPEPVPGHTFEDKKVADNLPSGQLVVVEKPDFLKFFERLAKNARDNLTRLIAPIIGLFKPRTTHPSPLPDEVFIDHSRSGCFGPAREQGKCGSCYIFGVVAVYEWHVCQATGRRFDLSEQYLVDCGPSRSGVINGCNGGVAPFLSSFVNKYGLALGSLYPYKGSQGRCPYEPYEVDDDKMSDVRVRDKGFSWVWQNLLEGPLKSGPLMIAMYTNLDFFYYGGGVDDMVGCKSSRKHVMVLVGSGRQDGVEYWLIRNSYGPYWGEQGYYKLSKKTANKCIIVSGAFRLKDFELLSASDETVGFHWTQNNNSGEENTRSV